MMVWKILVLFRGVYSDSMLSFRGVAILLKIDPVADITSLY